MPALVTQKDLRECRHLPFCYLCGRTFEGKARITKDHVLPRAIFAKIHRDNPLILPAHQGCNENQSGDDEKVSQLLSALHGKYIDPRRLRVEFDVARLNHQGSPTIVLKGVRLKRIVGRWLRGFHAALYREHLPYETKNFIHLPFPSARLQNGKILTDPVLPQQPLFVGMIKRDVIAQAVDKIECYSGRCLYECAWHIADTGQWLCVFALRIYDWENLGDHERFPKQGCAGYYSPRGGRPPLGTRGTSLEFPLAANSDLDPFN